MLTLPFQKEDTLFSRYTLSEEDALHGWYMSDLNLANLKNLQATIAEEKIQLEFTPNDIQTFTQQEAYKAGQLALLEYIMERVLNARSVMNQSNQEY